MNPNKIECYYCGKIKEKVEFIIGAGKTDENGKPDDFVMVEGTGNISCPDCYGVALKNGKEAIENHIKHFNQWKGMIMKVRVIKTQIKQTPDTTADRWFVEVIDNNVIHDMRNFDNENEALEYKTHLILTNYEEADLWLQTQIIETINSIEKNQSL
jgi:hypothetical protein